MELLLDHSKSRQIDIDAKDNEGETAFMWASRFGGQEVVRLLKAYLDNQSEEPEAKKLRRE